MSFDSKTNTIHIDDSTDFLISFGVFILHDMHTTAKTPPLTKSTNHDWFLLEQWLNCKERKLSKSDEANMAKAWKAYLAMGISPSKELQKSFDEYATLLAQQGYSYQNDLPPQAILDVFDRMLATKQQIQNRYSEKRQTVRSSKRKPSYNLTKSIRFVIVITIAWGLFVTIRTAYRFEFLGFRFSRWDYDQYFLNLLAPCVLGWLVYWTVQWVKKGQK